MAGTTRLELATSAVTGQRSNQLNYVPASNAGWWAVSDLNTGPSGCKPDALTAELTARETTHRNGRRGGRQREGDKLRKSREPRRQRDGRRSSGKGRQTLRGHDDRPARQLSGRLEIAGSRSVGVRKRPHTDHRHILSLSKCGQIAPRGYLALWIPLHRRWIAARAAEDAEEWQLQASQNTAAHNSECS